MKEQLTYFISAVFLLPFLPLLAWQGSRLKKRIPSIGEAAGPRTGIYEGAKPPLRLLALGESTFAGVGVDQQQDAITSIIGKTLQEQSGRTVEWNVIARSGYNAKQVLERLVPKIPAQDYDFIVIGLGGNDTFELNRPLRWKQQMTELVEQLNNEFPNSKIVIANLPPVGDFPAFPKSFQLLLGGLPFCLDLSVVGGGYWGVLCWVVEDVVNTSNRSLDFISVITHLISRLWLHLFCIGK
jgi:hypothetical protein